MELSLVSGRQCYSFVILLSVGSHRKFSHNFLYLYTSRANSIIVELLKIFSQFWHILWLDYHAVLIIWILFGSFVILSPSIFLIFIRAHYLPIQNDQAIARNFFFCLLFCFSNGSFWSLKNLVSLLYYTGFITIVTIEQSLKL